MESAPSESNPCILAIDQEDPAARLLRVGAAFLGVGIPCGILFVFLRDDTLVLSLCLGLAALLWLSARLGRRRMLVLRNEDLFTVGGEIDEGVPWSGLQAVEVIGMGVELVGKDGSRRPLALGFLQPGARSEAISRIVRHLEVFQLHGPLTLPGQVNVEIRSGALALRPVDRYDRDFCVSVELDHDRIGCQLAIASTRELAEAVFDEALPVYRQQAAFWKYVILVDETPAGIIAVHLGDPILRHAQIGIDLIAAFQNRGIGSEALRVLIEFFRRETSLLKISAGCFADNHRCRRALEKAGMRYCGSQTMFWLNGREWKDGLHFECVLSERDLPPLN